jgi:hypothetical protein
VIGGKDDGGRGPGPDLDLGREAERVADRLRVLGPRWAARDHAGDVEAVAAVRAVLQQLADLAAGVTGQSRRAVPELALHALGDQVLVLAGEVGAAGDRTASTAAATALAGLRRAL